VATTTFVHINRDRDTEIVCRQVPDDVVSALHITTAGSYLHLIASRAQLESIANAIEMHLHEMAHPGPNGEPCPHGVGPDSLCLDCVGAS
jgi:hypothetical protein